MRILLIVLLITISGYSLGAIKKQPVKKNPVKSAGLDNLRKILQSPVVSTDLESRIWVNNVNAVYEYW